MGLPIMKDYAQSPSDRGWLNKAGHRDGSAIDIGWRLNPNNPNQTAYSLTNALVLWTGYMNDGGNVIVGGASYDDKHDMWWSAQHLLNPASPKVGDIIKQGYKFGNMGNSGESRGEHFHVRVSLVPKGTKFNWGVFDKYRVNPINYVFAYPHQDVTDLKKKPTKPFKEPSVAPSSEKVGNLLVVRLADYGAKTFTVYKDKELKQVLKTYDIASETCDLQFSITENHDPIFKIKQYSMTPLGGANVGYVKWASGIGFDKWGTERKCRTIAQKPNKPVSNIGKYANLGGDMWLFESARTDKTYHPKGMGHNQLQPIRNRSAKILADDNGRVKISVPSFRPNVVWVAKSQASISDKPKYVVS